MPLNTDLDRPVLLLSPHLDDAVFSAGALVGRPLVKVWTVFAGVPESPGPTAWDAACGYEDSRTLMKDRLLEDAQALDGTRFEQLPLLERAYTTPSRRSADLASLELRIGAWIDRNPGGCLALPAGAGVTMRPAWHQRARRTLAQWRGGTPVTDSGEGPHPAGPAGEPAPAGIATRIVRRLLHLDHQRRRRAAQRSGMLANEDHLAVRDAGLRIAHRRGADVLLYEELPYLWAVRGDAAAAAAASAVGRVARRFELTPDNADKHARMLRYRTQLRVMDPEHRRLEDPTRLPERERYWWLSAAVDPV